MICSFTSEVVYMVMYIVTHITVAEQRLSIHVPTNRAIRAEFSVDRATTSLLGYTTILTTEEVFSLWSAPCLVLGNGTVNTHP